MTEFFPSEVKSIVDREYIVTFVIRAGNYWKWPLQIDVLTTGASNTDN